MVRKGEGYGGPGLDRGRSFGPTPSHQFEPHPKDFSPGGSLGHGLIVRPMERGH
jgi:hypothetical protein